MDEFEFDPFYVDSPERHWVHMCTTTAKNHLKQDFIYLNSIKVDRMKRGQGYGTAQMKRLMDYCDKNYLPIRLTPDSSHGTPMEILQKWYRKLGFVNYDKEGNELVYFPKNFPEHLKDLF